MSNVLTTIESRALNILETYDGANNYILKLQQKFRTNKKFYPTRSQAEYVVNYSPNTPKVAKKWVDLDQYFAVKVIDLITLAARVAINAPVLAAPVQVHVVLEPEPGVRLLDV